MRILALLVTMSFPHVLLAAEAALAPTQVGPPSPASAPTPTPTPAPVHDAAPVDPQALSAATALLNAIPAEKIYQAGLLAAFEQVLGDARDHAMPEEQGAFDQAIDESRTLLLQHAPWSGHVDQVAQRLARHLSTAEIAQLKAFLSTTAGQKTMALLPEVVAGEMAEQQHQVVASLPEIQDLVAKRMAVAQQAAALAHLPPGVALGKPFPEVGGTAVDGRRVSLTALKGKVVLIDFWATWCGPCMHAMPDLIEDYQNLHDKGFEIIGVSLDDDQAKLMQVVKERGIPWPQLFDGKGWESPNATRFKIQVIPSSFLIGRDGSLVTVDATGDLLVDAIRKAEEAK